MCWGVLVGSFRSESGFTGMDLLGARPPIVRDHSRWIPKGPNRPGLRASEPRKTEARFFRHVRADGFLVSRVLLPGVWAVVAELW